MSDEVQLSIQLDAEGYLQELGRIEDETNKLGKKLSLEVPVEFKVDGSSVAQEVQKADQSTQKLISSFGQLSKELQGQARTLEQQNKANTERIQKLQTEQSLVKSSSASYARIGAEIAKLRNENDKRNKTLTSINGKITEANNLYSKQKQLVSELSKGVKFDAIGQAFDSLIGKLTVGGLLVEAFKAATEGLFSVLQQGVAFQQLTLGLEAFTGGVQNAEAAYADFKDIALKTPFSVEGVAEAGKVMLAFGLSTEETSVATRQLAIVAGATGGDLNNLSRNLGQISAQGRAYTRDLNQFAIAGIPIYQELAKELNVSVIEVRKFAEEGSIGFQEVSAALANLTKDGSAFATLADKQLDTVAGQIGNVGTAVFELGGAFVQSTSGIVVPALKLLGATIQLVSDNIEILAGVVAVKAVTSIASLAAALKSGTGVAALLVPLLDTLAVKNAKFTASVTAASAALQAKNAKLTEAQLTLLAYQKVLGAAVVKFALFAAAAVAVTAAIQSLTGILSAGDKFKQFSEDIDKTSAALRGFDEVAKSTGDLGIIDSLKVFNKELGPIIGTIDTLKSAFQKLVPEALQPTSNFLGQVLPFSLSTATQAEADLNQATIDLSNTIQQQAIATSEVILGIRAAAEAKTIDAAEAERLRGGLEGLQKANANLIATAPAQIQALERQRDALGATTTGGRAAQQQIQVLTSALQSAKAEEKAFSQLNAELKQLELAAAQAAIGVREITQQDAETVLAALKTKRDLIKQNADEEIDNIKTARDAQVRSIEDAKTAATDAHETRKRELDDELRLLKDQRDEVRSRYDEEIAALEERTPAEQKLYDLNKKALELKANSTKLSKKESLEAKAQLERLERREKIEKLRLDKKEEEKALDVEIKAVQDEKTQAEEEHKSAIQALNEELAQTKDAYGEQIKLIEGQVKELDRAIERAKFQATALGEGADASAEGEINQNNWRSKITESADEARRLADELQRAASATRGGGGVPGRFSGGPVSAGNRYTVNELGKEAFLSASGRLSMINSPAWGQWTAPSSGTVIPAHLTKQLDIPSSGINLKNIRKPSAPSRVSGGVGDMALVQSLQRMSTVQHEQATELGRLSRTLDRIEQREWKVDVNIAGNNPLLNKLRRR
jgi:tape measure domain-containing protein